MLAFGTLHAMPSRLCSVPLASCSFGTASSLPPVHLSFAPSSTRTRPGLYARGPAPRRGPLGPPTLPRPSPLHFRNHEGDPEDSTVASVLSTSSVDIMLHSAHHLIDSAERRIGEYCSTFAPRDGDAATGAKRCWHVYRSLHQAARRLETAAGAEAVTTGRPGPAYTDLSALERLIRELEYVPVEDMVRVLAANEKLLGSLSGRRRRRGGGAVSLAGGEGGEPECDVEQEGQVELRPCHGWLPDEMLEEGSSESSAVSSEGEELAAGSAAGAAVAVAEATAAVAERVAQATAEAMGTRGVPPTSPPDVVPGLDRLKAEAVFASLDRKGRGWLDRDDLLAGLEQLGEHLDPSDVEQLCMELGTFGRIDLQAFCDIAEAERLMVPGSDAVFLRRLRHERPEWWTQAPPSLDQAP